MKKTVAFLLAMLLLLGTSALADVTLTPVLEGVGSLSYEDETNYIIVRGSDARLYGLYNTAGEMMIPCEYGLLDYAGQGYFEAINEEGLNNHALLNDKGEVVIDYLYAAYEMLGGDWCAAVVLEPAEGELYDYAGGFLGGGEHYLVTRYDIYRLSTGVMAGSLARADYERAKAHGDFLYVKDRADNTVVYDGSLTPLNLEVRSIYSAYDVVDGNAVCLSDGRVIAENVSSVSEDSDTGYIKLFTRQGIGLANSDGTLLIPCEYESIGVVYEGYAPVEQNGLKGLYDIAGGRLAVPCEYDDVLYFGLGTINRYMHNGYACVEKDGKVGFVDANGTVTCELKYASGAVTQQGCTLTITDMGGEIYIIAGDGTQTKTDYSEIDKYSGGDGSLLIVSKDDAYGVVDWHGNVLLPLEYKSYEIQITANADAVIVDDTLYAVEKK